MQISEALSRRSSGLSLSCNPRDSQRASSQPEAPRSKTLLRHHQPNEAHCATIYPCAPLNRTIFHTAPLLRHTDTQTHRHMHSRSCSMPQSLYRPLEWLPKLNNGGGSLRLRPVPAVGDTTHAALPGEETA